MSFPGEVLSQITQRSGMPSAVTFIVTDRCNYDCVHCYQEHDTGGELDFDAVSRILREIADAGVLFLTLMGGEFFVRRDADDILRLAHDLGFAIRLKTTGHHVHDRRADLIASMRPIHVDLSLYAARPHLHEGITRQAGSWQRTYDAARRLVARRVPVQLNCPVTESTVEDVEALARLADGLGVAHSFDPKITSIENGDQAPTELRMCGDTLIDFYGTREAGDFIADSYAQPGVDLTPRSLELTPCRVGQISVTVNPRGEIWPCNSLPMVCGDLTTQSFADVWKRSETLADVRELNWASLKECNVCQLRTFCDRCHGMAMIEDGDIRGPSLEACRHAVAVRDSLRGRGLVPADHVVMPPTWDRVDNDGRHQRRREERAGIRRPTALRIVD